MELNIGARGSRLSVAQSQAAIETLQQCLPGLTLNLKTYSTGGDQDKKTSLTSGQVPDDFFTDVLDQSVINGEIDAAIHSAKDLPEKINEELDWMWLPWREDSRDAILLPEQVKGSPENPVVGISSPSREAYALKKWPGCQLKPIRGDIENRIQQLDNGDFDIIILAVAGLNRLGLDHRINEFIELDELQPHEAQGVLAMTWKKGHREMVALRNLLTHPVIICGAGTGEDGHYSVAVVEALNSASICLYDSLMSKEILEACQGEKIHVGKRHHEVNPGKKQLEIVERTLLSVRRGERVVRLKGGDPSLFARLSEELNALNAWGIHFRLLPGIPWLCSAPIKHGMYLTERDRIRHFHVSTGTTKDGDVFDCSELFSKNSTIYFFMATKKLAELVQGLRDTGYQKDTPAILLRDKAGEKVEGTLENIVEKVHDSQLQPPALFVVGEAVANENRFQSGHGPLYGKRILITGSSRTQRKISEWTDRLDGQVIKVDSFSLEPMPVNELKWMRQLKTYDWLIFSSGSAVEFFLEALKKSNVDVRDLPKIAATGPSVAEVFNRVMIKVDFMPLVYTSEACAKTLGIEHKLKGKKVLIPRSSASQSEMKAPLQAHGAQVDVVNLYRNVKLEISHLPNFDIVIFCSPSSVRHLSRDHKEKLSKNSFVVSIGPVTTKECQRVGLKVDFEPVQHDVDHMMLGLASRMLWPLSH